MSTRNVLVESIRPNNSQATEFKVGFVAEPVDGVRVLSLTVSMICTLEEAQALSIGKRMVLSLEDADE